MLRRSRPIGLSIARHSRCRSSAAVAEIFQDTGCDRDAYGMEYGAGPSRIPYEANLQLADIEVAVQLAPGSTISSTRQLRRNLALLQPGDYVNLDTFARSALKTTVGNHKFVKRKFRPSPQPLSALSRLELHAVVHHLLRSRQPVLAAAVISHTATTGVASRPRRRRLFASRTLDALFDEIKQAPFARESVSRSRWKRLNDIKTSFTSNKQPVPALSHTLTAESQTLLSLLDSLQEVRHRRPNVMYEILIRQCVQEGRPDVAAKIFVGLVEEWVTEGRVAEGADIEDFCEGGGPSEKLEIQLVSDQMSAWWKGVRTWKMPGEVLSPHGRLDLWHPKNLSLGEKMKGFPMPVPTSPPTMVPAPDNELLLDIIQSLRLDPARATAAEHETSMRALAYLANTVLSRTLPISSLRSLFHAMSATVHRPAVYPEGIDPESIPQSERWAYESFTQIHLALQSLLSAPPMSANSIQYAQSVERAQARAPHAPPHPPPAPSKYMLPPLRWTSCLVLLRYGMSRLKMPGLVKGLVTYMKQVFGTGHTSPAAHNIMLESATRMRDNSMAEMVARPLFGDILDRGQPRNDIPTGPAQQQSGLVVSQTESLAIDHPHSPLQPIADVRSLTTLITHLNATSQSLELEQLVYKLIPYLSHGSKTDTASGSATRPESLPLELYPVILSGLRKAGKTGLAQRVFQLAKLAEVDLTRLTEERYGTLEAVDVPRLPIDAYTEMINVYANEVQATKPGKEWVKGWKIQDMSMKDQKIQQRDVAAAGMAWRTYNTARLRWREATTPTDRARCNPDSKFFIAISQACVKRWELKSSQSLDRRLLGEVRTVMKDMAEFGITGVPGMAEKLGEKTVKLEPRVNERDPAVALAEMWLRSEGDGQQKRFTPL